jgi:tetratricopeptide (TPR) repeat protein
MSADANGTYDPNVVIKAANAKLEAGDVQGGQTLYQSSLFNWVDDAQFGGGSGNIDQLREAIATLWISYAHYLQKAKQYKSATDAYEDATKCPVSGRTGSIWTDYARFLEERGKVRSAQQIYLRALVGDKKDPNEPPGGKVQDEQDRSLLWSEFLTMMQTKQPDLTLSALKKAVEKEHTTKVKDEQQQPDITGSGITTDAATTNDDDIYGDLPMNKRPRLDNNSGGIKQETNNNSSTTTTDMEIPEEEITRRHVVTASDVKIEETALLDITQNVKDDPLFMSTWMIRDGDSPPQAPEPPLFDATVAKLTDPSGKDLLGEDLALQLVQRLLEPNIGNVTLQVCRGLWMLTALKEDQSTKALGRLDEEVREEFKKIRARLDERLSVAGAAESAVRTMNESELHAFENSCNQQRRKALDEIAWDFRKLLWVQQQFLTKLKVPGFRGPTVDAMELQYQSRVCTYLHSAFFLRQRIGEKAHSTMMKSQEKRLIDLKENPRPVVPGVRSRSPSPVPPSMRSPTRNLPPIVRHSPTPIHAGVSQQYQMQPQQQYSHVQHQMQMQMQHPPGVVLPPNYNPAIAHMQQQQLQQPYMNTAGAALTYQQQMMMQANYAQQQQQQQQQPPPPQQNPPYYR